MTTYTSASGLRASFRPNRIFLLCRGWLDGLSGRASTPTAIIARENAPYLLVSIIPTSAQKSTKLTRAFRIPTPCCEYGFQFIRVSPAIYRRRGKYGLHPLFDSISETSGTKSHSTPPLPSIMTSGNDSEGARFIRNQDPELPPNTREGSGRLFCPLGCILQSENLSRPPVPLQLYFPSYRSSSLLMLTFTCLRHPLSFRHFSY